MGCYYVDSWVTFGVISIYKLFLLYISLYINSYIIALYFLRI